MTSKTLETCPKQARAKLNLEKRAGMLDILTSRHWRWRLIAINFPA